MLLLTDESSIYNQTLGLLQENTSGVRRLIRKYKVI